MIFLVYPHMIPPKSVLPDMSPQLGRISDTNAADPARKNRRVREETEVSAEGLGDGASTANVASKAERYRPKIFGFQVHEVAKLQRWQDAVRDRCVCLVQPMFLY
jgi:casein kinase II subunit beta